jgi:hypothetical protein
VSRDRGSLLLNRRRKQRRRKMVLGQNVQRTRELRGGLDLEVMGSKNKLTSSRAYTRESALLSRILAQSVLHISPSDTAVLGAQTY